MKTKVFFSFHYEKDSWRAAQVRNMGVVEGNKPLSDNDWETIKNKGDMAIKKWINEQLENAECTIVLIGSETAERKWVKYEIEKSWNDNKCLFGIYIHNLKNQDGEQSSKGKNPFDSVEVNNVKLSKFVKTYDPPFNDSNKVYNYIKENIESWVDDAKKNRKI